MRIFSYISLVLILTLSLTQHWRSYWSYQANRQYIAQYRCINAAVPESGCQGKCYLKKQLLKDQKEQNKPLAPQTPFFSLPEVWALHMEEAPHLPSLDLLNLCFNFAITPDFLSEGYLLSIDHPPESSTLS